MLPHLKSERQVCSLNYMVDVNQLELSLGFPKKDDNCTSSYFERRATAVAGPMFHAVEQNGIHGRIACGSGFGFSAHPLMLAISILSGPR